MGTPLETRTDALSVPGVVRSGRKITVTMQVAIQVDEATWADEYGMAVGDVASDVGGHLRAHVEDIIGGCGLRYLMGSVSVTRARLRVEA